MSQPKPVTVLLILAVFACVALYVLGVGLGMQERPAGGRAPVSKEEREHWRERFVTSPPVAPADLRATGCGVVEGTARVARETPCQVAIARSGSRVRTLNVEPLSGCRVTVELRPGGGPMLPVTLRELGGRRRLDVPEEGATLTLTCTQAGEGGSECRVKLR